MNFKIKNKNVEPETTGKNGNKANIMKKYYLFFAIILFICKGAISQETIKAEQKVLTNNEVFKKGTHLIEANIGNISFSWEKNKEPGKKDLNKNKYFDISLTPRLGTFFSNNFMMGAQLSIGFHKTKYNYINENGMTDYEHHSNNLSLGCYPFMRFYFGISHNAKSIFHTQFGGGVRFYPINKSEGQSYDDNGKVINTSSYTGNPNIGLSTYILSGWNYLIAKNIALNINFGYQFNVFRYSSESKYTELYGPSNTYSHTYDEFDHGITWDIGLAIFLSARNKMK